MALIYLQSFSFRKEEQHEARLWQKVRGGYPLKDGLIEFQLLRQLRSRSDDAGNVIETHEHGGEFREAS